MALAVFVWNQETPVRAISIDILYTLDSASNYSTIQKLKPRDAVSGSGVPAR